MKKIIERILILCTIFLFTNCASERTICGRDIEVYGLFSLDEKIEWIDYDPSIPNIFWSVVLVETVFIPVWLLGWELYEPQELDNSLINSDCSCDEIVKDECSN